MSHGLVDEAKSQLATMHDSPAAVARRQKLKLSGGSWHAAYCMVVLAVTINNWDGCCVFSWRWAPANRCGARVCVSCFLFGPVAPRCAGLHRFNPSRKFSVQAVSFCCGKRAAIGRPCAMA
jgi:hypothetical protein